MRRLAAGAVVKAGELEARSSTGRRLRNRSSRSRRLVTTKVHLCASWKSAASAGHRRTPRSSARCSSARMSKSSRAARSKPSMLGKVCRGRACPVEPRLHGSELHGADGGGARRGRLRARSSASTLLRRFYKRFREQLDKSKKLASVEAPFGDDRDRLRRMRRDGFMVKKWGKNGWFLSCERYPEVQGHKGSRCPMGTGCCGGRGARDRASTATSATNSWSCKTVVATETSCRAPDIRACKNTRPVPLGVACPQVRRRSSSRFVRARRVAAPSTAARTSAAEQKCEFKLWARPIAEACPDCGALFLTYAGGKKPMIVCATKGCGFKKAAPEEGANADEGEAEGAAAAPEAPPEVTVAPVVEPEPRRRRARPHPRLRPPRRAERR
jgi:ssDNA-binding Zn-finger/Zn-ribbon topoisomerase 1